MTEVKHTPTWRFVETMSDDGQEWFGCGVVDDQGSEFVWLEGEPETDIPKARLIAAAPEMLEALREVIDTCRADCPAGLDALRAARAAVAKAEGRT